MWWIIFIISIIVIVELLLRLHYSAKQISPLDVTHFPFYTKPKNKKGRDPYFVERIGKEKTPLIRSYSEGIRGDIAKTAQERTKIILALGCSVTEGAAFNDAETYPGQLQKMLQENLQQKNIKDVKNKKKVNQEYVVINAGMGGYGPFQIENMYQRLTKYKPKIALVQLLDFKRTPTNPQKVRAGKKHFIFYKNVKKVSMLAAYLLKLMPSKFIGIRSPYMARKLSKEKLWELNKKYLDRINESGRRQGIKLVFFVWPSNDPLRLDNAYFQQKMKEYCHQKKVYYFDARNLYKYYQEEELTLKNDGHPSFLANKLIAKAAYHCLIDNRLIS